MIWCVEHDAATRNIEVYTLQSAGFDARGFENADSFWNALRQDHPELVVMDTVLPGIDGVEVLKQIRASSVIRHVPVIMASRKAEFDIIRCLDSGADDCMAKPFNMMEMVSRVRAVLRRYKEPETALRLTAGRIALCEEERKVRVDGKEVELTYKEFELLLRFLKSPGEVFSREQLYTGIWGKPCHGELRTVDMHIRTLRKKLGDSGTLIESVRYIGYRLKKVP